MFHHAQIDFYQSLVGSVVIGAELSWEDHGSIPATAIGRGHGTT
jgi:hypothetical protein